MTRHLRDTPGQDKNDFNDDQVDTDQTANGEIDKTQNMEFQV